VALIVAGALLWGGATLLLNAWWGRRRVDLGGPADAVPDRFGRRQGPTLARQTELSGHPPGRVWISLIDAAAPLGLSCSGFVGLVEREGIAVTQRNGRRAVAAAQLAAYLERCQIAPGSHGPELVPYGGRSSPTEVRHLDLLDAVAAGLAWTDGRLAREVGVNTDTVARWRTAGVPNSDLLALRALRRNRQAARRSCGSRSFTAVGEPMPDGAGPGSRPVRSITTRGGSHGSG
jgi:hypothetical protein